VKMIYQIVLRMSTKTNCLRSDAIGWSVDSANEARKEILRHKGCSFHVGSIGAPIENYTFPTVLHALGSGFRLLAPPIAYTETYYNGPSEEWEWWLVKDEDC